MRPLTIASMVPALALAFAGCLGLGSGTPATRSYVLTAVAKGAAAAPEVATRPIIGIAAVSVPRFLDRPQIVTTAAGSNEIAIADLDRWAEPLADGILRTLAADLAALVPAARVERHPWPAQLVPGLEVRVDILRFDGTVGGKAAVEARWVLRRGKDEVASGVSKRESSTAAGSHGALVSAWSQLLGGVAEDIAAAIAQQRE